MDVPTSQCSGDGSIDGCTGGDTYHSFTPMWGKRGGRSIGEVDSVIGLLGLETQEPIVKRP